MYKIKLNDGTVLENLELNGNNYISENVVEDSVLPEILAPLSFPMEKPKKPLPT